MTPDPATAGKRRLEIDYFLSDWTTDPVTGKRGLEIDIFLTDRTPIPATGKSGLEIEFAHKKSPNVAKKKLCTKYYKFDFKYWLIYMKQILKLM